MKGSAGKFTTYEYRIESRNFWELHRTFREGIESQLKSLAYDPRPAWTEEVGPHERAFRHDDPACEMAPLRVSFTIDDDRSEIVVINIEEVTATSQDRRVVRFFAHGAEGRLVLESFLEKMETNGATAAVGDLIAEFLRERHLVMPTSKPLGQGLHELRTGFREVPYRIYYGYDTEDGEETQTSVSVVMNGSVGKDEQPKEIEKARGYLKTVHSDLKGCTMTWDRARPLMERFFGQRLDG